MKRLKILMLVALLCLVSTFAYAAVTSTNVAATATVSDTPPEMTLIIKELTTPTQDPWSGTDVTNMAFGTLTHLLSNGAEAGVWYSQKYYCVFAFTQSFGKKYEVRSTCTGVGSGANSLPSGSFLVTPGYAAADEWSPGVAQGLMPTGAALGAAGSAVVTNKAVYTSEAAGSNHILRAFYSIPNSSTVTGFSPVPLTQAPGNYSATVTLTIAAI